MLDNKGDTRPARVLEGRICPGRACFFKGSLCQQRRREKKEVEEF